MIECTNTQQFVKHLKHTIFLVNNMTKIILSIIDKLENETNENKWNINKDFVHATITQMLWMIFDRLWKYHTFIKHLKHTIILVNIMIKFILSIIDKLASEINEINETSIKTLWVQNQAGSVDYCFVVDCFKI